MKILQERKRNAATGFRPIVVEKSAVDAHTHNLGVSGLELFFENFEAGNLPGSSRCPIQRIEYQHAVLLTFELVQSEFGAPKWLASSKSGACLPTSIIDVFSSLKKIKRSDERSIVSIKGEDRNSM
jgi:hypothetical protein